MQEIAPIAELEFYRELDTSGLVERLSEGAQRFAAKRWEALQDADWARASRSGRPAVNDAGRVIGDQHHRAKITDADVELIRQLREQGNLSYRAIADKWPGISRFTVRDICKYRRRSQTVMGHKRIAPRIRLTAEAIDESDEVCA